MSPSDLAIVAALIFIWGTLSARLERFDVTAPITFILAGLLLTHGPLAPLGFAPSNQEVKALAARQPHDCKNDNGFTPRSPPAGKMALLCKYRPNRENPTKWFGPLVCDTARV